MVLVWQKRKRSLQDVAYKYNMCSWLARNVVRLILGEATVVVSNQWEPRSIGFNTVVISLVPEFRFLKYQSQRSFCIPSGLIKLRKRDRTFDDCRQMIF
jgi:hypothetical protein